MYMSVCDVPCRTVSYCVVQCRTVSYCVVLCRTVSYCVVPCRTVSYCVVLCRTVSYCVVLCRTVLYCVVLCRTVSVLYDTLYDTVRRVVHPRRVGPRRLVRHCTTRRTLPTRRAPTPCTTPRRVVQCISDSTRFPPLHCPIPERLREPPPPGGAEVGAHQRPSDALQRLLLLGSAPRQGLLLGPGLHQRLVGGVGLVDGVRGGRGHRRHLHVAPDLRGLDADPRGRGQRGREEQVRVRRRVLGLVEGRHDRRLGALVEGEVQRGAEVAEAPERADQEREDEERDEEGGGQGGLLEAEHADDRQLEDGQGRDDAVDDVLPQQAFALGLGHVHVHEVVAH